MEGLSGINQLRQRRPYTWDRGKRSIGRSTEERREEHWCYRGEKGEGVGGGENKIKEENRWQFFTSFLKRGLGTRRASLNRFFQRGAQAGMKGVKGRRRERRKRRRRRRRRMRRKRRRGPFFCRLLVPSGANCTYLQLFRCRARLSLEGRV